jgi:hypothetical protein
MEKRGDLHDLMIKRTPDKERWVQMTRGKDPQEDV